MARRRAAGTALALLLSATPAAAAFFRSSTPVIPCTSLPAVAASGYAQFWCDSTDGNMVKVSINGAPYLALGSGGGGGPTTAAKLQTIDGANISCGIGDAGKIALRTDGTLEFCAGDGSQLRFAAFGGATGVASAMACSAGTAPCVASADVHQDQAWAFTSTVNSTTPYKTKNQNPTDINFIDLPGNGSAYTGSVACSAKGVANVIRVLDLSKSDTDAVRKVKLCFGTSEGPQFDLTNTRAYINGAAPTCGVGCATVVANSNDRILSVTSGAAVTAVTVNFSATLSSAPVCVASTNSATVTVGVTSVSTTAVTFGLSASFTGTIYAHCLQNS